MKRYHKQILLCASVIAAASFSHSVFADQESVSTTQDSIETNQADLVVNSSQELNGKSDELTQESSMSNEAMENSSDLTASSITNNDKVTDEVPDDNQTTDYNTDVESQPQTNTNQEIKTNDSNSEVNLDNKVKVTSQITGTQVSINQFEPDKGQFDVTVDSSQSHENIEHIAVAVWSENSGQDDLKWYQTSQVENQKAVVSVDTKNHQYDIGVYNIHAYITYLDGQKEGIALKPIEIPLVKPDITINENTVTINYKRPAPNGSKYETAIWSTENDQDDLRWYKTDGKKILSIDRRLHKGNTYRIDSYISKNNTLKGFDSQIVSVKKEAVKEDVAKEPSTEVIRNENNYQVLIKEVNDTFEPVTLALKSSSDDSDLKWYNASKLQNGNYQVTINDSDFSNSQNLEATIYGMSTNGNMTKLKTVMLRANSERPKEPQIKMEKEQDGSYFLSFNNIPSDYQKLKIAVWSEKNGQDDLNWLDAKQVTDNQYQLYLSSSLLHEEGNYFLHVYGQQANGNMIELFAKEISKQTVNRNDIILNQFYNNDLNSDDKAKLLFPLASETSKTKTSTGNTYIAGYDAWYIYNRFSETGETLSTSLGNAKDWLQNAQKEGYETGTIAKVDSIVTFDPNVDGASSDGHVAFVEHVNSDGSFIISELATPNRYNYNIRMIKPKSGINFIYRKNAIDKVTSNDDNPIKPVDSKKGDIKLSQFYNSQLTEEQQAILTYQSPSQKALKEGFDGNQYTKGYATWYVYNRAVETGHKVPSNLGNAEEWAKNASNQGIKVDDHPQVGDMVQFDPGVAYASQQGHVAFVEYVNSDGSFLISEMATPQAYQLNWRVLKAQSGMHFIHL